MNVNSTWNTFWRLKMEKKQKFLIKYQEKFGVPGNLSNEDVNARLAELDSFLDGFFIALAWERREEPVSPMQENMRVIVSYDEQIDYTRISIETSIMFEPFQQEHLKSVNEALNTAIHAFMGSRFPSAEGQS